jgi:hypothetical protein
LKEDHLATPSIPSATLETTNMESYRMVTKPRHALDMFGAQKEAYDIPRHLLALIKCRFHTPTYRVNV